MPSAPARRDGLVEHAGDLAVGQAGLLVQRHHGGLSVGAQLGETVILDTYGVWQHELGLTAQEQRLFERVGAPGFYCPNLLRSETPRAIRLSALRASG